MRKRFGIKVRKFLASDCVSEWLVVIGSFLFLWIGGMLILPESKLLISAIFALSILAFSMKMSMRDISSIIPSQLSDYVFCYLIFDIFKLVIFAMFFIGIDEKNNLNIIILSVYFVLLSLIEFVSMLVFFLSDFSFFNKTLVERYSFEQLTREIRKEGIFVPLSVDTFELLWNLDKWETDEYLLNKEYLVQVDEEYGTKLTHIANTFKDLVQTSVDYDSSLAEVCEMYCIVLKSIKKKKINWDKEQKEVENKVTVNKDLVEELKNLIM